MTAKIGLFQARAAPISTPMVGVGPGGDKMARKARLSAKASHRASPRSTPAGRWLSVKVLSPLDSNALATSAASGALLAECEIKTSQVLLWFGMEVLNSLREFICIVVE